MMNTASWIILSIVIAITIGVIVILVKTRDRGCCGCSKEDCPCCKKKDK